MRVRLAHLSDPHLPLRTPPSLPELASKRVFGYLNWMKNRRRALGEGVLDRLVADLAAQSPDHVCLTGDLVNIATDAEFADARKFLELLGPPERVSVVPGNHDAYVPGAAKRAVAAWAPWVGDGAAQFPWTRRVGPIALIGVSTAVATAPLYASGRLGRAQLDALAAVLDRNDDAIKVLLIHHPPDASLSHGRRGLDDVDAVREVLSAGCVDVVLHGHTHEPSLAMLPTARGSAAVVGVPSASSDGSKHAPAGYALIDVFPDRIRITRRTIGDDGSLRTTKVDELKPTTALAALAAFARLDPPPVAARPGRR